MNLSLSAAASEAAYIAATPATVVRAEYIGKLLLPGKDLTITVTKTRGAVYVDGRPAKIGRACRFIDVFKSRIINEVKADLDGGFEQINIIGMA